MKFDIKKLLTVKDEEEASKLIGKMVYVSNDIDVLKGGVAPKKYLISFNSLQTCPFLTEDLNYTYCYPCEEEETKYRPFTFEEAKTQIGNVIVHKERKEVRILISCREDRNGVFFGDISSEILLRDWIFEEDGSPCGTEVENV